MTFGNSRHPLVVAPNTVLAFTKRVKLLHGLYVHRQDPHTPKEFDRLLKRRVGLQNLIVVLDTIFDIAALTTR